MLAAMDVSFALRHKLLLSEVSLALNPGEVVAVVGANGAGKSTLLRLLCGDLMPSSGQIELNHQPLNHWSSQQQASLRAVLPQSSRLDFPFKVEEVVFMGRSPYRHSHSHPQNWQAVQAVLQLADVQHLQGRLFTTLSGGEQQRVQLARVLAQLWQAAAQTPRYLLLDEPTSALDLAHQHQVLAVARNLARTWQVGVLAVLHDLNLAALYADRIALLKQGRLLHCDSPINTLTREQIQIAFGLDVAVIPHPQHSDCPLIITHALPLGVQHKD